MAIVEGAARRRGLLLYQPASPHAYVEIQPALAVWKVESTPMRLGYMKVSCKLAGCLAWPSVSAELAPIHQRSEPCPVSRTTQLVLLKRSMIRKPIPRISCARVLIDLSVLEVIVYRK